MNKQTDFQIEKEARDNQIYTEYMSLVADGTASTVATQHLMKKYGIHSASTLWAIRKRVEDKLAKGCKNGK